MRGLTKTFEERRAVDAFDLDVEAGEIVGLVGVNGAGKTTFIRMLAGILRPDEGHVEIAGHVMDDDAVEARRQLAFVPDTPQLFDALTVHEHLLFVSELYQVAERETRIDAVLREFALLDREHDTATALSRGMRQKLAICCAFLHEPAALLLDEPLTGLDPPARRVMSASISRRAAAGAAVLVSSHQLDFVERLATRFVFIHEGQLKIAGTLDEIRTAAAGADDASLEDAFLAVTGTGEEHGTTADDEPAAP